MGNPNDCMHPGSPTQGLGQSLARSKWVAWPGGGGTPPRSRCLERLALALGANSLDKGAGTWAEGVLSPKRRQAGTTGPVSTLSLVTWQAGGLEAASHTGR